MQLRLYKVAAGLCVWNVVDVEMWTLHVGHNAIDVEKVFIIWSVIWITFSDVKTVLAKPVTILWKPVFTEYRIT